MFFLFFFVSGSFQGPAFGPRAWRLPPRERWKHAATQPRRAGGTFPRFTHPHRSLPERQELATATARESPSHAPVACLSLPGRGKRALQRSDRDRDRSLCERSRPPFQAPASRRSSLGLFRNRDPQIPSAGRTSPHVWAGPRNINPAAQPDQTSGFFRSSHISSTAPTTEADHPPVPCFVTQHSFLFSSFFLPLFSCLDLFSLSSLLLLLTLSRPNPVRSCALTASET